MNNQENFMDSINDLKLTVNVTAPDVVIIREINRLAGDRVSMQDVYDKAFSLGLLQIADTMVKAARGSL